MKIKLLVWHTSKRGGLVKTAYACKTAQEAHRRALGFRGMKCKVIGDRVSSGSTEALSSIQ